MTDKEIMNVPPPITPLIMTYSDIALAERAALRLGYTQTAYTSSSGLWGLFCLPDSQEQMAGQFIKTEEFGLVFIQDLEDLKFHDLAELDKRQIPRRNSSGIPVYP